MSESEKSEIQVPIRKRSAIKGQVTKFYNYLQEISKNTPISSLQSKEIVLKIEKFQTLLSTFDTLQTEIELNCSDLEEQLAERELIEENFHKCIALAQEINESASVSKTEHQKHESEYGSVNNSQCSHRFSSVKLPTIKLPSFDGNYLKWLEFRDTFDSLINSNENIPNINKFHYLRSSLEGGALVVIKSIEFTSNNYKVAWDLVCQRYNNKNLLINNHLKALFNIEALTRESHKALRFLIDLVSKNLRALNTLGQPTDKWDALIIYMVSTKLDSTTSRKWEELKNGLPELPTLEQFNDFLRNRADVLETTQVQNISRNDNYKSQGPREQKYSNSKSFVSSMSNNNSYKKSCDICHESHHLHVCSKFNDMSTEARLDTALKLKLCLNCLRSGHTAKHCFLKGSCKYCNKKHNSLLHKDSTVGCSSSSSNTNNNNLPSNTLPTTLSAVSASQVLLCTAIVEIVNPENNISYRARALLDTGSQSSFITNKFKIKLGLQTQCSNPIRIAGIGNVQCDITERCSLKLFSCIDKSFNLEMMCLVVPQITSSLPTLKVDVKSLGLPANIILADPEFHCPSDIDMLLGADVFWEIVGTQQIGLGRHRPILQSSKLGWLVTGPIGIGQSNLSHENSYINVLNCSIIKDDIHDSLQRFWEVEELPSNKISYTLEEQACENSFKQNTSRLPSGRFLVKMPLKESPEEALGDSYNIAKRRFFSLENKLDKNPNIKKQYVDFIKEYLDLGHLEDTSLPLKVLQLNTVTYGTASAPFLSTRCLLQLAEECTDMSIANIIKNDFYYDDLSTGASTEDELLKIYNSVTEILSSASFPLRKIRTNCPKIFENDVNNNTLNLTKQSCVLGLNWSPTVDLFTFPIDINIDSLNITKRTIISTTCKIFDPLGVLCACIITAKIILQHLWSAKIDWDDSVPDDIKNSWIKFTKNLSDLSNIKLERNVICDLPISVELHCFVDASQNAYSACVYLRTTNNNNQITVKLLCSKARVAPLKPTTIPRLELCGALLGARLCAKVLESLRCNIISKTIWTDSMVVLGWLKVQYKHLKAFVRNRVNEINEITADYSWRHVPTDCNPADLASRGVTPQQLQSSSLWWEGPSFLRRDPSEWPQQGVPNLELPELKVMVTSIDTNFLDFTRYSNFTKLKRIMAYVHRFVNNFICKYSKNKNFNKLTGCLSTDELCNSLKTLIRCCQVQSFSCELNTIKTNKELHHKSKMLPLKPFIDEDGILRVGGRIQNTNYNFEKRHPIILDAKHSFTKLLMRHEHLRLFHAGPQLLLSSIREEYWPIGGRNLARSILRKCVVCIRFKGKTLQPIMGNLPNVRTNPSFPFYSCGTDFAGPFMISSRKGRGSRVSKCYLCLFVCLTTKAVHLELVSDLTTQGFLMCLRRFVSRRGKPYEIYSDNGKTFVGANNELGRVLKSSREAVTEYGSTEGIRFKFSPAYSPHFGGIWEAGVKSSKHHLKRIAGNAALTFEELATLFTQIEAILNSRPLSPLSSDPTDLLPLTPGHFLIGRPLKSVPSLLIEKSRANRYERIEQLRQQFWERWRREYLAELQQRTKWRRPDRELKVGDLVILKEDNLPPLCWRLGRITKLYQGPDGVSRVADVLTSRGTVKRAVHKFCIIPGDDIDPNSTA
ncbi:uncharacterized protein LOC124633636 isoform X1 [Helicoverpa zea]|uniref:uncharacterized protein LOC124633636 isoform X1 n=1 Tax=Helicoverpa zea TaxID=7113 RepID=UPI001F597349|nr:uncharacterized protein LOC124633636 isoform X1 [Helicoverpa zea]